MMAGQKLGTDKGVVEVSKEGFVEVEDKAVASALKASGFKLVGKPKPAPQQAQQSGKKDGKQPGKK